MKIAITGGAGFIATALARRLKAQGNELILLDIRKSESFPEASILCDITDPDAVIAALAGVDAIYHLAAEHRDDVSPPSRYTDVNVSGGRNVLAAAEAHKIKTVIFTSTVAVYPLVPADPETGSSETHTPAPFNDYGRSKHESEADFQDWAKGAEDRRLAIMRLVATFGPGNRGNIYTLMRQIAAGRFIMIGNGANRKSVAYVENVAAFLQHLLHHMIATPAVAHLYNYADKPDLTMGNFVAHIRQALGRRGAGLTLPYWLGFAGGAVFDLMAALTGRTFPISRIRIQKFCANTIVCADKLHETGFHPPYTLEQGLQAMIQAEFSADR